jgi:hypothetical protein
MPLIFCGATDFLRRKYINIRGIQREKVSMCKIDSNGGHSAEARTLVSSEPSAGGAAYL